MRLKEFIIFIIIFTVFYIAFFIIFDKVNDKRLVRKQKEKAKQLIKDDKYLMFAQFYGIQGSVNSITIFNVYEYLSGNSLTSLSVIANVFNVSVYEIVVIILYLEYLNLIPKKCISIEGNNMRSLSTTDQSIVQKYNMLFIQKSNFQEISRTVGSSAFNDLVYLDSQFLIPGVRFINSILYYVGDCS